jgi:hypothetical protein
MSASTLKNKNLYFPGKRSKKVVGRVSPAEALKEFNATLGNKVGRPQKFNRNNGLVADLVQKFPKYVTIGGVPHKIQDGKYVPLTLKK